MKKQAKIHFIGSAILVSSVIIVLVALFSIIYLTTIFIDNSSVNKTLVEVNKNPVETMGYVTSVGGRRKFRVKYSFYLNSIENKGSVPDYFNYASGDSLCVRYNSFSPEKNILCELTEKNTIFKLGLRQYYMVLVVTFFIVLTSGLYFIIKRYKNTTKK